MREWAEEWDVATVRINVSDVAKNLDPLLKAEGGRDEDALGVYNAAYRLDSTFSVHGMGSVLRYLDVTKEPWSIQVRPEPLGLEPATYINLAGLYTAYFAGVAFKKWGYKTEDIAELLVRLGGLADLDSPISPATRAAAAGGGSDRPSRKGGRAAAT